MEKHKTQKNFWREALIFALILAIFIVPRAIDLDRFITIDEGLWMFHSSQFYYALGQREFENTFQRFHPGVPMMWAGTLGFLTEFPEFRGLGQGYLGDGLKLGSFLEQQGVNPLDLVVAGRKFMIAQNAFLFMLSYWIARKLLPMKIAAPVFALISLEPFFISLTYILQMDGLMASYMFSSILALLAYMYAPDEKLPGLWRKALLLLSGVMGGLGILTKAPAVFLFLFAGLMLLIDLAAKQDFSLRAILHKLAIPLALWLLVALIVMVAFWPALWVEPIGIFTKILSKSSSRATAGIGFRLFFNGVTTQGQNFPWYFYPYALAWRSTPLTLVGLAAAALAWIRQWGLFKEQKVRQLSTGMALAAFFFTIEMGLGAMKMDRYIIPTHLFLSLVSALGWIATGQRLSEMSFKAGWWQKARNHTLAAVLVVVLAVQITQTVSTYPYYYAYYNPLLGGTKGAEKMFWLGWGEGLEQVGAYLNTLPDAENTSVMSLHAYGPLSYFFEGKTLGKPWPAEITYEALEEPDYIVIYVSEKQTNYLPPVLEVLSHHEPELVVTINGVSYAQLYAMSDLSAAEWDFLGTRLPSKAESAP